ncbi:MAG: FAD:protein FMN transferase [Proteobacteria bacterium]|nr:FAD:protein FMN transferase [Pseudomonadota bacterium]
MNRRTLFRLFLATSVTPLIACHRPQQAFNETIAVFGTLVNLTVYAQTQTQATQAFSAVNSRFQQIHSAWHAWEKGGLVSKINDAIAQGRAIEVDTEVAHFIQRNQLLCQQTQGLFDPGIGKLIKLWGFQQNSYENNHAPSQDAIQALLAQKPSIMDITWHDNLLFCANPSVALDFGASGKAYALNAATETLKTQGIENATIVIGGDIQVLGTKPEGPWQIGINDPNHPGKAKAQLALAAGEVACSSGTYERFYTDQGKKVSHIIHPLTGQTVTHVLHSTAIHNDALIAEVGALTQLIAGPENWQTMAHNLGIEYSYLIPLQGKDIISPALLARLA